MALGVGMSLETFTVVCVFIVILDVLGLFKRVGLFFVAAGMIGTYLTGQMFATGNASTALYEAGCTGAVAACTGNTTNLTATDANLAMVLAAVLAIMSLSLIFILRQKQM